VKGFGLSGLLAAGQVLSNSNWQVHARDGVRRCLEAVDISTRRLRVDGTPCGPMAQCELLMSAALSGFQREFPLQLNVLTELISAMLRPDGSIHPDHQPVRIERDNDYLPNAAILALACHGEMSSGFAARLKRHCMWQLHRFRRLHAWGQVGWLPQACAALYLATGDISYANSAFEVVDWSLDQQVEVTGAFLTDLSQGGPTFHTAFVAEAVADAWKLAMLCGDHKRIQRYASSWWSAMRFCRHLIIRPVDAPCLADSTRTIGGVRGSLTTSIVRIDYVSHLIISIVKGLPLAETMNPD
jgi:hypothetical protein